MRNAQKQPNADYVCAAEAMKILGVRQQTLYAYVSRGWILSVAQKGLKDRLYRREDLARVCLRSLARSGHAAVAASAMNWGEPILQTSITEITSQGPCYRGHPAADLVRGSTAFESVAELLWSGLLPVQPPKWPVSQPTASLLKLSRTVGSLLPGQNLLESFALVVLFLGLERGPVGARLSAAQTLPAAREIIHTLVAYCGFASAKACYRPMLKGQSVVGGLMHALDLPPNPEDFDALQAILILLADHELPPGTLGARVVASAGGTLHSCIASALCATSGVDVGRMYEHVQGFLGQAKTSAALVKRARRLIALGQSIPGFDHPLYPKGDPRAVQLLDMARKRSSQTPESRAVLQFIDQMRLESSIFPRQELAVVVMARGMGLPAQVPAALFALARVTGWVAHVEEQRASGTLFRPRARFVKPA